MDFSANIGFLWPELELPERIQAAAQAGFAAVECHFPYAYPPQQIADLLEATGLPMLSLNTQLGAAGPDDFGVAARPDRIEEARGLIDEAIDYARAISCRNVSVVAGRTGRTQEAEQTFRSNLTYACQRAAEAGVGILIEPINTRTVPGFHLHTVEQAIETIEAVAADNLKIMFDCFHLQIMQGDLYQRFVQAQAYMGHVQIAAVHDRGEPDRGEIDYHWLLTAWREQGWQGLAGAEYKPRTTTDDGLHWKNAYIDTP